MSTTTETKISQLATEEVKAVLPLARRFPGDMADGRV